MRLVQWQRSEGRFLHEIAYLHQQDLACTYLFRVLHAHHIWHSFCTIEADAAIAIDVETSILQNIYFTWMHNAQYLHHWLSITTNGLMYNSTVSQNFPD